MSDKCLRHFLADSIICMHVFDFRQAQVEERGIAPHIPVNDKWQRDDGTFSRSDFQYDPTSDVYHCPGGKRLGTSGTVHNDKTLLYRASRRECGICPLKRCRSGR
jgi:hypothetical protein